MENYTLKKLMDYFNKAYDRMPTRQEEEYINEFDDRLKNDFAFNLLVGAFVSFRGDIISSDREAAAFMTAIDEFRKECEARP